MKTLSVKQPWARLILSGDKDIENRTWSTPYRGPLLIAATKQSDPSARATLAGRNIDYPDGLDFGAVLGVVTVVDCVRNHPSEWAQPGAWHWVLTDPWLLPEPFPVRGQLGIFDVAIPERVRKLLSEDLH